MGVQRFKLVNITAVGYHLLAKARVNNFTYSLPVVPAYSRRAVPYCVCCETRPASSRAQVDFRLGNVLRPN